MAKACYLEDIKNINKILSDTLLVISNNKVNTMKYLSCSLSDFDAKIELGVIIVSKGDEILDIEYCNNIVTSINKFAQRHNKEENLDISIIYDIENVNNQERALKMIENYLGLIFNLD